MNSNDILHVKDLSVEYHTRHGSARALNNITFSLAEKEIFGLVGESGSGKSTTAKTILQILPQAAEIKSGQILFREHDLLQLDEKDINRDYRGNEISMVIQNPQNALNPVFTVKEQLLDVMRYNKGYEDMNKKQLTERAVNMLSEMGIAEAESRISEYPHQFSGGMKQRVMLAMAFICNPSLLLADEPTTALDVTIEAQILQLLKDSVNKFDTSVLYITHDLSVINEVTDRTAVMYAGNIVEIADTDELFSSPEHPYTIGLIKCIPGSSEREEILPTIPGRVASLTDLPSGCNFYKRCDCKQKECRKQEPQLQELSPGHFVACFRHGEVSAEVKKT